MPLWYKGSVKFRYDARSYITVPTPLDRLLEKLLLHVRAEQHTIAQLTDTPKPHTEVEVIPYPVAEILCVWLNRLMLSFVPSISRKATYSSKIRKQGGKPR